MLIVIDPGHGGHDPGAVANGLKEKNLTLDIALRIRKILETEYAGVQVRLTRDTDTYLGLSERARLGNQWGADFFLSIHINAGGGTGWESYRHTSSLERTVAYQNVIHPEVVRAIGAVDRGKKAANFAVLRETAMPALLTENLFIDHAQDAARLKDPAFREKLARGHVIGMEKAFGLKKKKGATSMAKDQTVSSWAKDAQKWVKQKGISDGLRPKNPVTREELWTMLWRAAGSPKVK